MTAYTYTRCSKCDREFPDGPRDAPYCRSGEGCGGLGVPADRPDPLRTNAAKKKPSRGRRRGSSKKTDVDEPPVVAANDRDDRILPTKLAMVSGEAAVRDENRAQGRLFAPAYHLSESAVGDQQVLPGFEIPDTTGPCLPLALYDLGVGKNQKNIRAAPLALRIFIESCLAVPLNDRGGRVRLMLPFRDFLDRLWPHELPRPAYRYQLLEQAVVALDSKDARIPWEGTDGEGGLWRVVSIVNLPRGPDHLNDELLIDVELPPGSGPGPVVSPRLHEYFNSATAYRALLNLPYRWFDPGRTRTKVGKRYWVQSNDPERYPGMTEREVMAICYPTATVKGHSRREYVRRAKRVLERLAAAGELRIERGRIMPPAT